MKRVTKILTVLTVLVIVIVNSVTAEEVEKFDGEGVRRMAGLIGTPLDVTTRSRLSGKAFGQKRSSRSTDVILINRSFRAFRLTSSICTDGTYTADLTPEEAISSMETQVFGVESNSFATGVECTTKYSDTNSDYFELTTRNPFLGKNSVGFSQSSTLTAVAIATSGNHNQVQWTIRENLKKSYP